MRFLVIAALDVFLGLWSRFALAADTTETFGQGATDFELYAGFEGIGLKKYERAVTTEALAGFGFQERWSGYLTLGSAANDRFSGATGEFGLGTFATVLDSDHLDLDLFLGSTYGEATMAVAPAFELNLDARPDLAAYGMYLRGAEVLNGRDAALDDSSATETEEQHEFTPSTELTLGAYLTIKEGQQLLLEYDMAFHHGDLGPEPPPRNEVGGLVLGYNRQVLDNIELVTQAGLDIPNKGEKASGSVSVGIIATMPSAAAK